MLRRAESYEEKDESKEELVFEKLKLNEETYKAIFDGEEIELTLKEFNILKKILLNFIQE